MAMKTVGPLSCCIYVMLSIANVPVITDVKKSSPWYVMSQILAIAVEMMVCFILLHKRIFDYYANWRIYDWKRAKGNAETKTTNEEEQAHFEMRSVEEEKELRDKYEMLTKETEGRICRNDVISMWREMITCPAVDYINSTFEKMNINENVPLSFDEFRNIWLKSLAAHSAASRNIKSEILAEFNRFDANKDGFIDMKELKMMVECQGETISEDDLEEFFKMADTNCDGKISFEEYAEVFLSDKL